MRDKTLYRVLCLLACAAVLWGATSGGTAQAQGGTVQYVVKRGDTLYSIARAHGVTSEQIQTWNAISDPRRLSVGQVLTIHTSSGGGAVSAQAVPQTGNQVVSTQVAATPAPLVTTLTVFGVIFLFLIAVMSIFDRRRK